MWLVGMAGWDFTKRESGDVVNIRNVGDVEDVLISSNLIIY